MSTYGPPQVEEIAISARLDNASFATAAGLGRNKQGPLSDCESFTGVPKMIKVSQFLDN